MDDRIREKLSQTADNLGLFRILPPSEVELAFNFPVNTLEHTDSRTISRFVIMLSQYLITIQINFNTARVMAGQKRKVLDKKVKEFIFKNNVGGKTLAERERNVIDQSPEFSELETQYDIAAAERDLLEGLDKPIIELINAFKSELRRRAEERDYITRERS